MFDASLDNSIRKEGRADGRIDQWIEVCENKADTGYKMRLHLARVFEKALRTYGRTDGRTGFYRDA